MIERLQYFVVQYFVVALAITCSVVEAIILYIEYGDNYDHVQSRLNDAHDQVIGDKCFYKPLRSQQQAALTVPNTTAEVDLPTSAVESVMGT